MAKYLIQTYNREMTELISQEDADGTVDDVLSMAYNMSSVNSVIVLMKRNSNDPTRLRIIAKFY